MHLTYEALLCHYHHYAMEPFNRQDISARNPSFRTNLFQPSSPPRVTTEPPNSAKKSHLSLHSHHHKHHNHHHRRHSRHARDIAHSAAQLHPLTSVGDLLKSSSGSSRNSPSDSRRHSQVQPDQDRQIGVPERRPVRPEDVARERAKVKARESELRSSLQALSETSLKTSRQLDDTYYSILEKVSVLRQTIGNLQELSTLTQELHETFKGDAEELVEDAHGQLEGFSNFHTQQEQIESLEARIRTGREKANALTARLEEARKQVDARAKVESEWEARTTRRLRWLWSVLGTVLVIVFLVILFQRLRPLNHAYREEAVLHFVDRANLVDAPIPEPAKEAILGVSEPQTSARRKTLLFESTTATGDAALRAFDEL
ncbi:hypothetical protein P154DRAFT_525996 [Amniculicola lignicola CBS 123094]|uniref:Uncharacterized protein n=1 Tax=Amniculicola lignicola CBS 123094 TaxID=1392246 RepID=A0A6A5W4P4_9PLEO|nr:hypothetical protein P154DRAFT_525996 [Amniculicola lignicola CBS 123094]